MNEPFIIAVVYQGTEHEFKARFERWGYTHRIAVLIDEVTVFFEPDEEGGYRALNEGLTATVNLNLLQTVAEKLIKLTH
ncbi:hypothetical protein [Mucilaginibacter aquariorum]|uniref:Uncharacterized protein n=1 Tax=Mucilaginibacter aquariorum TaxID=2967225 RepID=A0ABT1SYH2_9SPHI|nr:hypothetical protein [Mucilaginibacter aquariorum]MCQ6957327.1 hypothetical protein [Mucilaginibacter aquariorum]